ncbi:hypothetical protein CERSUDRAFT_31134, partial [Gelatoporia subvermispora B]
LTVYPRVFALGSSASPHVSCTADSTRYDPELEPIPEGWSSHVHDWRRSGNEAWEYLLRPHQSGEILVKARGRELFIAGGYVRATCCIAVWEESEPFISEDCPGSNESKIKKRDEDEDIRSFVVPQQYQTSRSSDTENRQINIFAAMDCADRVFLVVDYDRSLRMHVTSLSRHWTQEDLEPGSDGPDWIYETSDASKSLDDWREKILSSDSKDVFSGFGEHLANDLLHLTAIWPGTPSSVICADDTLYKEFKEHIASFMQEWHSPTFRKRVSSAANFSNPLAFNYCADANYVSQCMHVYQKQRVRVSQALYNRMLQLGLLETYHAIGQ